MAVELSNEIFPLLRIAEAFAVGGEEPIDINVQGTGVEIQDASVVLHTLQVETKRLLVGFSHATEFFVRHGFGSKRCLRLSQLGVKEMMPSFPLASRLFML